MEIKFLGYQILAIGIIWTGMAFFFSKMTEPSKVIFYVVTSWLLFLIVLFVKKFFKDRKR
ncbi:hypothetical protein [Virgibacillus alimentarius]|uniref:Uncharacterized protein n=1 Tax=Virgibacillus alimentarius TaxID=698769 RepID=A0ABS4SAI4_9BACI|nr:MULTISPECIES: hypothetical protein [Virgibacillus]MBP2258523.1 hypothetical protein [Virgibacillus alimentarius]HLR67481.1 hypothetical protein [Virgibacillus sp.]